MNSNISQHQNFIDWMKAAGMLIIVYGHVFGSPFNPLNEISQPIYSKQLGVAFFIFVMGWSLGNESRTRMRVVFNRLFPIYFYGILSAIILSCIFIFTKNDINESNYLPFILGINVFLDYFPANTTTWYIGTYLHLLLFWYFFLQNKSITIKHLLLALIVENIFRMTFIALGQNTTAYMILPNWLTIFLLGVYLHQQQDKIETNLRTVYLLIIGWVILLLIWQQAANAIGFSGGFPFRQFNNSGLFSLPILSILISLVYLINTLLFFEIARRLPGHWLISFFSRNTLIIFIAHIPVIFELSGYFYSLFETKWIARIAWIIFLYVGLALISELIQKFINIKSLRERAWKIIAR